MTDVVNIVTDPLLYQVAYVSSMNSYDIEEMQTILKQSRQNNRKYNITGLLLCHDCTVLQFLEGNESIVNAIYAKILRDDRHRGVTGLLKRNIAIRDFQNWDMEFREIDDHDKDELDGLNELMEIESAESQTPSVMSNAVQRLISSYRSMYSESDLVESPKSF